MSMTMMNTRVTPFTGTQLRTQRPAARRPSRNVIRASEGQKGAKRQGSESTMGENKQAQQNVENMAAPDGDRALSGEKAQRGGEAAGPGDYDPPHPEGAKGAEKTTPAGQESSSGVAQDGKSDAAKGTF